MTVGGWFDAEDLYGALHVYQATEEQNPGVYNMLVMGPWAHGGWSRSDGDRLGNVSFGDKTGPYYREKLELAFFNRNLKGKQDGQPVEAAMFETGSEPLARVRRLAAAASASGATCVSERAGS